MEADPLAGEHGRENDGSPSSQLSCVQCRNRKLKCDRKQPICGRCDKQKEACSYPGSKQRNLGRRKTVQELEDRIEELESLLRNASLSTNRMTESDLTHHSGPLLESNGPFNIDTVPPPHHLSFPPPNLSDAFNTDTVPPLQNLSSPAALPGAFGTDPAPSLPHLSFPPPTSSGIATGAEQPDNGLIALGLYEQLPSFDVIDALTDLYFNNVHSGAPMLHQASYTAALRLPPHMRPPMCLQYIVMATAAATSEGYRHLSEPYYQRARVYAEADELKGKGELFTTVAHVQAWCLLSAYDCHVHAIFTRASTSLCRAVRIAQMLKLHLLDMQQPEQVHIGLPPARTSIEAEERRRTWWVVFLADRYLACTTGWPSLINERHVQTNLPASDEAFSMGVNDTPIHLSQGLRALEEGRGDAISSFAVRILAANELLHTLDHGAQHTHERLGNGVDQRQYWERYRQIERNLDTLIFFLPEKLLVSPRPRSLDAILVHVCTNLAIIQLYQTALGVLQLQPEDPGFVGRSKARLLSAADNIVALFRAAGDGVSTAIRNPILSFAAYIAASVFLENHLEAGSPSNDNSPHGRAQQSKRNLHFLAQILVLFGQSSSLVRAHAFQLAADMQRTGYDTSMIDIVTHQLATLGGSASQIRIPGSKALPMFFCPALTTTQPSLHPPTLHMSMDPILMSSF